MRQTPNLSTCNVTVLPEKEKQGYHFSET